jgi:predicted choloylglycine hydrolase
MSAMNADGLVIGQNDVYGAADGSPNVNLENTPTAVLARRILEECSAIPQAERVLQKDKPASRSIFVTCDKKGGAAIEVTPKTVVLRREANGFCVATNHFRCKELSVKNFCRRGTILAEAAQVEKLGVADVAKKLHEVHQGKWTAHAIVFEPATLKIHVAFGDSDRPATAFPMKEIDLAKLLKP